MRKLRFILLWIVLCITGWACGTPEENITQTDVILETDMGDIYLQLYDETPKHKANFLKLVQEGYYDGLNFHRIIYNFMIQSGDPRTIDSLSAINPDLPDGPGYTLEAEVVEKYVHTRGKIGAARYGDEKNPERRSSGSQFYIVTGEPAAAVKLDSIEAFYTSVKMGELFETFQELTNEGKYDQSFESYVKSNEFKEYRYPQDQRKAYLEEGGSPWLDFQYTVFGEVVSGMDVVDKIGKSATDNYDRPRKPIRIKKAIINKKNNNQ